MIRIFRFFSFLVSSFLVKKYQARLNAIKSKREKRRKIREKRQAEIFWLKLEMRNLLEKKMILMEEDEDGIILDHGPNLPRRGRNLSPPLERKYYEQMECGINRTRF